MAVWTKDLRWQEEGRKAVLEALDRYVASKMLGHSKGWIDADLPELFKSVDAHLERLAERLKVDTVVEED